MNAFITGGSRGIGRSIVLKMVKEGYECAFTYCANENKAQETIEKAKEINNKANIKAYRMDQANSQQVEAVVEQAINDFENIQVLVNNAAIVKNNVAVLMSNEEWDSVISTNLSGPFYVIRSFLMHMLSNRMGRIINISSLAQDGASGQANYAASKAGLVGLTKVLSREYGIKGITANVVAVGYVETDMTDQHLAENLRKIWLTYCPMKRVGQADEIADMVYYLTTEKAGFINGEVIRICGGLTYIP